MDRLTSVEMDELRGGMTLAQGVDWGCGALGVWSAFGGPVGAPVAIFCAGWAIGRLLS